MPVHERKRGFLDDLIIPHSTRKRVGSGVRECAEQVLENPWKKQDNIPLRGMENANCLPVAKLPILLLEP